MTITSLHGDALDLLPTLTPGSIQALITSPPYYGLRSYDIPPSYWPEVTYTPIIGLPPVVIPPMVCQLGAEPDPLAYIGHLVHVFRLARPALRKDATLWVNLGDSYGNGTTAARQKSRTSDKLSDGQHQAQGARHGGEAKQLLGIPARAALALQADGWVWRNDIIWHAPNKMPESVRDRFTRAYEDVLLFGNSTRYYFDSEAVAEEATNAGKIVSLGKYSFSRRQTDGAGIEPSGNGKADEYTVPPSRNRRDVWSIPSSPMPAHLRGGDEAHYAAWPPALAEIMVKAASANKACSTCGAAWVRQVEKTDEVATSHKNSYFDRGATGERGSNRAQNGARFVSRDLGFAPACACGADTARCVVLDPFGGTGTTGAVCVALGRDCVLIDLGYQTLQARRTDGVQVDMEAFL